MVTIFGMINLVPATAHNVFCHSADAHILTPPVNLAFRPKSGSSRVRVCDFGLGPGSGFKMRPFYNPVWECRQGPTRGDWKDTSSTHQQ